MPRTITGGSVMIGYPDQTAALTASAARTVRRTAPKPDIDAALLLEDGSWAAGLGYVCGEQHRRRWALLPDGRSEQLERNGEGPWRIAGHGDGPLVHWLERIQHPIVVSTVGRVPLRYAISLTWRQLGRGAWLVVERGIRSYPRQSGGIVDGISDGGVILERAISQAAADQVSAALRGRSIQRLKSTCYEVVHESTVRVLESSQPYGVLASEG